LGFYGKIYEIITIFQFTLIKHNSYPCDYK
jgi:hypothetical protein